MNSTCSMKCSRGTGPLKVHNSEPKFLERPHGIPVLGDEEGTKKFKRPLLLSGNDYLGLGSHPTIGKAASKDCLLCPTGFAANVALMLNVTFVGLPDQVAQRGRKAVVTDSLFSMDGDFAPMIELVKLRKEHDFLLIYYLIQAHGTFVCGKNGGGVAEEYHCEKDVDICVGTLSKAAGCHGGFIACRQIFMLSFPWKQLIHSRGRSFIFSTAMPAPIAASAHAALIVARKETWRRRAIWNWVQDFRALTGIPINSHIISLIVGSEVKAEQATQSLLKSGFHVIGIIPPVVPHNSCRLRVTLSATHTRDNIERITVALSHCVNFQEIRIHGSNGPFSDNYIFWVASGSAIAVEIERRFLGCGEERGRKEEKKKTLH
ncbi:hypothetical protein GBA52_006407 [Prunus armeniaca]|nr:hypothetical protein GBA52_006407 [Prunus armeniaca]